MILNSDLVDTCNSTTYRAGGVTMDERSTDREPRRSRPRGSSRPRRHRWMRAHAGWMTTMAREDRLPAASQLHVTTPSLTSNPRQGCIEQVKLPFPQHSKITKTAHLAASDRRAPRHAVPHPASTAGARRHANPCVDTYFCRPRRSARRWFLDPRIWIKNKIDPTLRSPLLPRGRSAAPAP